MQITITKNFQKKEYFMKFIPKVFLVFVSFIFNYCFAQATHDVGIVGFEFSPQQLTIKVNDKVRWTNDGGLHDVLADDNSFSSGDPSMTLWVFEHTFNTEGNFGYHCTVHGGPGFGMFGTITVEAPNDVNDDLSKSDYKLNQNYPNPFNPKTTIEYSLSKSNYVTLKVFNVTGSLEKTLISEYQSAGNYLIEFNSDGLTSGIYFYQLISGDFISTKRMVLLK
jgi:plastocyanin